MEEIFLQFNSWVYWSNQCFSSTAERIFRIDVTIATFVIYEDVSLDYSFRYVKGFDVNFLNESFKNAFYSNSKSSLELITNMNWFNRPTVVFYERLSICYNNLIEMKAFRNNLKKPIARILLSDESFEQCEAELDQAVKDQKWVLIQNLSTLSIGNQLRLSKKINIFLLFKTFSCNFINFNKLYSIKII